MLPEMWLRGTTTCGSGKRLLAGNQGRAYFAQFSSLQSRSANDSVQSVLLGIPVLRHIVFHCGDAYHVRDDGKGQRTFARCAALLLRRLLFCQEQEDFRVVQEPLPERSLAVVVSDMYRPGHSVHDFDGALR